MSRLTKKIEDGFYTSPNIASTDDLKYKLGKLEDIEEELGIDLITLFKALKDGFYTQNNHHTKQDNTWLGINDLGYCKEIFCMYFDENMDNIVSCTEVDTRDYGKTWALTKEELENDK